jgi:hypothetical protein
MDEEFRALCIRNLYNIRALSLPFIVPDLTKEAILYTFEDSQHLEFLIRLAILNLGAEWSYTILCGTQNVVTLENIRNNIHPNIKVINTGIPCLDQNTYNMTMLTPEFWNQFTGSKLLFYDADSCICGDFSSMLDYDFIGHKYLTLRSREIMLKCLTFLPPGQFKGVREDVFFKQIIMKHTLGSISHLSMTESVLWKPWTYENWKDRLMKLIGKRHQLKSNIIIYILCYNQDRYELAKEKYRMYHWAKPLIMKYQDYTFENTVWKQLLEIQDEWFSCEFVGTLSFTAFRKINIDNIHRRIVEGFYTGKPYVNFNCNNRKILEHRGRFHHPNFKEIWIDTLRGLKIDDITENACNYWMCRPDLMVRFIEWHHKVLRPVLMAHPLIFTDAEYGGAMTPKELIDLWGQPYYPHVPFIMERINKAFFDYFV